SNQVNKDASEHVTKARGGRAVISRPVWGRDTTRDQQMNFDLISRSEADLVFPDVPFKRTLCRLLSEMSCSQSGVKRSKQQQTSLSLGFLREQILPEATGCM
ncbi:hypothetical protein AMECASPLE_014313, partial [Ameca splendens]